VALYSKIVKDSLDLGLGLEKFFFGLVRVFLKLERLVLHDTVLKTDIREADEGHGLCELLVVGW